MERIREIIVGRHLERLEGRVARLESSPRHDRDNPVLMEIDDRLLITEAKVEALHEHVHRIEGSREESLRLAADHRQEAQRLAAQIHEMSRAKAEENVEPAVEKLERKLGEWLTDWQKSLHTRLDERDRKVSGKMEADLAELRETIEARLASIESGTSAFLAKRLDNIAVAARALAESAETFSTSSAPKA